MDLCTYFFFLLNLDSDLNPAGICQMLDFVFSGTIQSVLCEAHTAIQETWARWTLLKDPEIIYIYLFPLLKDFLVSVHIRMLNFMDLRIKNTIIIKYKNSLFFFFNLYGYQKCTLSKIAKKNHFWETTHTSLGPNLFSWYFQQLLCSASSVSLSEVSCLSCLAKGSWIFIHWSRLSCIILNSN